MSRISTWTASSAKKAFRSSTCPGLIGALSPETSKFCLELARAAKKHGTRISFDLNYRASFWKGREKELRDDLHGNRRHRRHPGRQRRGFPALPRHRRPRGRRQGPRGQDRKLQGHDRPRQEGLPQRLGLRHHAAPGRQRQLPPLGRDHGRRRQLARHRAARDHASWTASAAATALSAECSTPSSRAGSRKSGSSSAGPPGALATTMLTDYAQPADEEQVWSIWQGNARVKR